MKNASGPFGTFQILRTGTGTEGGYYSLLRLEEAGVGPVSRLPVSLRIILESVLRNADGEQVTEQDIRNLASWKAGDPTAAEIPFTIARVVMQDFTGVPAVVDLAAMRSAMERAGLSPDLIDPLCPVDLVVDHSVQVDAFGTPEALRFNTRLEFERNNERYKLLKWGKQAFENFNVVPPSIGIVHQVNLEYLARGVFAGESDLGTVFYPDTLVGTDSHTTMINGIGIVGWGVGGIEAEAALLGQPITFLTPEVVGFRMDGEMVEGVTATDLVLTVVEQLRQAGVVGKFVEFYGPGVEALTLPDRATIANMCPEYGATMGFFPVDEETLDYYRLTGRDEEQIDLIRDYFTAQGMFGIPKADEVDYSEVMELDLSTIEPCVAGPRLPQARIPLGSLRNSFEQGLATPVSEGGFGSPGAAAENDETLEDGDVVIAAITSCTNTSNPMVMLGAGLLAKKAVEKGLTVPSHVKTSLAPGSRVVTDYLEKAGLLSSLEAIGFNVVGYGCTTCIGNSGPLPEEIGKEILDRNLVCASVLSGNRNFEARIHTDVRASYLASPPLVVAFALAGTVRRNLANEPVGIGSDGDPVWLKDIWPAREELIDLVRQSLSPEAFREKYADIEAQAVEWNELEAPTGTSYAWDLESTYIQEPPYFMEDFDLRQAPPITDIEGSRALLLLGDNITTDHISPAGAFASDTPAGRYLVEQGVEPRDFNSFGSRRGNHQVMIRGTFANMRVKNQMVAPKEGGFTRHQPDGDEMSVFEASSLYREEGVPLIVLAGVNYGTGSSRDWAAKGTRLLGVRAVAASSFERIHRSNLVGMGVLPLQFRPGENPASLGLDGTETFDIRGLEEKLTVAGELELAWTKPDGSTGSTMLDIRIDTPFEIEVFRHGGILDLVMRRLVAEAEA